jgi:hypothetical protein
MPRELEDLTSEERDMTARYLARFAAAAGTVVLLTASLALAQQGPPGCN